MKISNLEKVNEIQNKIKELHNLKSVLINKPTCFATQIENELKKLGVDVDD